MKDAFKVGDIVEGFAYGYATRIIEEMASSKHDWEEYDTWCGKDEYDLNFHVRDGYLRVDVYEFDPVTGDVRTDNFVNVFKEWVGK